MGEPSSSEPVESSTIISKLDQIQSLVNSEFEVEEVLVEHGVPTFYVKPRPSLKQSFIRLFEKLKLEGFIPVLRERKKRNVLKVVPKPSTKPSRPLVNIVLFLLTVVTVLVTGYVLSLELVEYGLNPLIGAASFAFALLGVLGVHEMAHKLAANHHKMEATMPYFIPGPPPLPGIFLGIGTFGAVIVQKETAPNRDALFDVGASGPIAGFIVATIVSAVGLMMSPVQGPLPEQLPGGGLPISPLFLILMRAIVTIGTDGWYYIMLHPVAFAGWIGIFVTLLNLLPTGMLDGGHTLRSIVKNDVIRTGFTIGALLLLLYTRQFLMLAFVLFLSSYRHPGPLDDVSKISKSRKLVVVLLIIIFALSLLIF